jgi:hypothetical protein
VSKVFFAIPTLSGEIEAPTTASLQATERELLANGDGAEFLVWKGDSIIPQARNYLVAKFLASDCTDLFFIDADVSWEPGAVLRMLSHPVDFVAGVYRHKKMDESYPVNWLDKPELWADPDTGLLEVRAVPMGFTRLTRAAVERMTEASDRPFLHHSDPSILCHCLFDLEYRNGLYIGEDYVFCERWRELGGQVWIDPELTLGHTGKHTFTGNIGKWLKGRANEAHD